jgi:hypothetical protein
MANIEDPNNPGQYINSEYSIDGTMHDDGQAPDATAGDGIYSIAVDISDNLIWSSGATYWVDISATDNLFNNSESEGEAYNHIASFTITSTATQMTAFNFTTPAATGAINQTNHTVALTVPYGTDVTGLVPTFTLSTGATLKVGSTVQTSGVTPQNFTNPVTYTVTAQDGITTQNYIVTVSFAANTAAQITAFTIPNQTGSTTINQTNHTVALTMPYGTNFTGLIPTFTLSAGATLKVGSTVQTSGVTPQDFTNPVTYTVTAQNGTTTQNYVVTVTLVNSCATANSSSYILCITTSTATTHP